MLIQSSGVRIKWLVLYIGIVILGCASPTVKEIQPSHPNVILIVTDDQGWGDLSLHDNPNLVTPNLDALATSGAQFKHFYVQPVCSPTRAEILTGRYAVRGGVYSTSEGGERLDLDERTIADMLQANNYRTAALGKWHSGMQYPYHPLGRGFDYFYGFCSGHWGSYFDPMLEENGKIIQGQGYLPDDLTDQAIKIMHQESEDPFFIYLAMNTPHSPMQVPDTFWNKVLPPFDSLATFEVEEDEVFTRAALAMVENIDWNVGRLIDQLEALNIEQETIVLFCSDNGPNSWRWNGGMRGRKGSTDEGGVRSPLFVSWPGTIDPGTVLEPIAGAIDIFPTIADLTHIEFSTPKPLDGTSLAPILRKESNTISDRMLISHWNGRTSVRNQHYRLDDQDRLYDLRDDPGQKLALNPTENDIYTSLIEYKQSWEQEVLSELPDTDDRPLPVGHAGLKWTQLPARDAKFTGAIQRSNRWPNCSFLTDWQNIEDSIYWEVEVVDAGTFRVWLHYTLSEANVPCSIELSWEDQKLSTTIGEAHDPQLQGAENDRVVRGESYVKDFRSWDMGNISLSAGQNILSLTSSKMSGSQAIDFRLLMLERIEE